MTKRLIVAVLCVAAAACGGSSSPRSNSAVSQQFSYGSASQASSTQQSVVQSSLTGTLALQSAPTVSGAMNVTELSSVTTALLGAPSYGLTGTGSAQQRAMVRARSAALASPTDYGASFDNPACVTSTDTSVKLSNCTITINETSSDGTVSGRATANGSVAYDATAQNLTWDLDMSVNVAVSGSGGSGSGGGSFHAAGSLTATAPTATADGTVQGSMTTEISMNASAQGQSMAVGMDEALIVNLTYRNSPTSCVTGGTLEAKRTWPVWSVPGGTPRPSNKAALVTFTGCGTANIQLSI